MPASGRHLLAPWLVLALLTALTVARFAVNAWLDPLPLSGDEAQYWLYGEHLAGGYYSKPPLLPWLMRASTELFGDSHWAMRLPSLALHVLIAFTLFLLGRELYDDAVGGLAALVYLTLPAVSLSSMLASTDPPMMFGWALATLALVLALKSASAVPWVLTGAAVGFGLLGKYTILAWIGSAALVLLLDPVWRRGLNGRGLLWAAAAALVVAAPNLVWNVQAGFPTFRHLGENADLDAAAAVPLAERAGELGDFALSQVGVFGPIAFALLLWLVVRPATWHDPRLRLLLGLGLPLLVAIGVQAWLNRANANWAAPAYLTFSVAVAAWLVATGARRLTLTLVAVHLLAFGLIAGAAVAHRDAPSAFSSRLDPFRKMRGVDEIAAAVAPVLEAHPEARLVMTDRMLMANVLEATGWPLARAVMWNPDGIADNHYELVTAFPETSDGTYVVLLRGERHDGVLGRFESHALAVAEVVRTHVDREIPIRIYVARGFLGYGEDG